MIIDAHLHLPCYDDTLVTLSDKKDRLLNDLAISGVDGAIVIADSELSSVIGTPKECVELFYDMENIFVMGGISPMIDFEARLAQLDNYLKRGLMVACKLYPGHESFYMNDSRLEEVFRLCEKHDVPLAVHTGWDNAHFNHPKYFAKIAEEHSALRIVICHLWWPDIDLCYSLTSEYPNVFYDISSLAYEANRLEKTRSSLSHMAENDAHRIVFGSDYGMCSIKSHIDLVNSLAVDDICKQLILCDNAVKLFNLKFV